MYFDYYFKKGSLTLWTVVQGPRYLARRMCHEKSFTWVNENLSEQESFDKVSSRSVVHTILPENRRYWNRNRWWYCIQNRNTSQKIFLWEFRFIHIKDKRQYVNKYRRKNINEININIIMIWFAIIISIKQYHTFWNRLYESVLIV